MSTAESRASTTPPQKGKNPGPGRLRDPSWREESPWTAAKIATASQNRPLTRSRGMAGYFTSPAFLASPSTVRCSSRISATCFSGGA